MMRRIVLIVTLALVMALIVAPQVALAVPPDSANCWGQVTSQRATSTQDIGEHSSQQTEPRVGLGNLARILGFDSVGEMGAFLAEVDGIEATSCP
jgi:hypothetical protein